MMGACSMGEGGLVAPAMFSPDLSVFELVVATIVGRKIASSDAEFSALVSDICCRKIAPTELRQVADRLALKMLISSSGSLCARRLTVGGISAVKQAQDSVLRLIDNNSGLYVVSAMMGLFDNVQKES